MRRHTTPPAAATRNRDLVAAPRPSLWFKLLPALLCLLLAACATPQTGRLQPAAPAIDSASDEAGLIMQMDRFEADLQKSAALVRDPVLNRYLATLTCRIAGDYCPEIRVYLVRQPYFNAQMAPNGMLIVWTGLLLRVEDEAQLAFVLGHEVGHYVERHSLARWRKLKSTSNLALALQVLGGGGLIGAAASLGAYGTLFAFGRDQERAADDYGLVRLRELGYDDRRAGALWAAIWDEEKVRERELLSSILATHPASEERRDRLTQTATGQSEQRGAEPYWAATEGDRAQWLEDEISRRHYAQTEVLMRRLRQLPHGGAADAFYSGEMYRRRAHPGDFELAVAAYRDAIGAADEAPAATWRGLGLALRQLGDTAGARQAWREYLQRAPQAEDRAIIEGWLQ
jgi:beta-barrel assembly-enhancing protease